jgi:hypothetical protein
MRGSGSAALLFLAALVLGCGKSDRHGGRNGLNSGNGGASQGGTSSGGRSGAASGAGGDDTTSPCLPNDARSIVAPQRIVRLTRREVVNTARTLEVIDDATATAILSDPALGTIGDETQTLFPPLASQMETALIDTTRYPMLDGIAKRAAEYVFEHFEQVTGCGTASDACATAYLTNLAAKAYRRPLSDVEERRLVGLYERVRNQTLNGWTVSSTVEEATRSAVRAILVAPETLWRSEVGDPDLPAPSDGAISLSEYELATSLSFFLTMAQTDRLLATPAARSWLTTAMFTYYRLNKLPSVLGVVDWAKVEVLDPRPLVLDMQEEASRFLDHALWNLDLAKVLTSRTTFLNENLATNVYRVAAPGATPSTFVETELPPDQRAGLVTLAGSLMLNATDGERVSLVRRGLSINHTLLCGQLPAPPEVSEMPSACADVPTAQQEVQCRAADPQCSGCHDRVDPYGLALDAYDNVGRYRTSVTLSDGRTVPVDPRATLPHDLGSVRDAIQMAEALAASPLFTNCMAATVLQSALAEVDTSHVRPPSPPDEGDEPGCAVAAVTERYAESGEPTFAELVRAVVASPAFGARRVAEP